MWNHMLACLQEQFTGINQLGVYHLKIQFNHSIALNYILHSSLTFLTIIRNDWEIIQQLWTLQSKHYLKL